MRLKSILFMFAVTLLGGCGGGDGDDLVGSLSLEVPAPVDLTGGNYQVSATAKYTHPTANPLGTKINFNTVVYTNISTLAVFSDDPQVNSSGEVSITYPVFEQRLTPIYFDVSAKTGDLEQFKRVSIPALASLSVIPSAVAFADSDPVGTTKTFTVTGGVTPYSVASDTPGEIGVSVSGGTVTVTLVSNPAGIDSATITVTDARSTPVTATVGY